MKSKWMAKLGMLTVAASVAFSSVPVFADSAGTLIKDVSETDLTTLTGEAKLQVSVTGSGKLTGVNAAFKFSGDLKYKSVDFLQGSNDLAVGSMQIPPPDKNEVNAYGRFTVGLISTQPIAIDGDTAVFVITFSGKPGEKVNLTLDEENSFIILDGVKEPMTVNQSDEAVAVESANESQNAVIKVVMDKVTNFNAANKDGVVSLTLTNQRTGNVINANLTDEYRGDGTVTSFIIENAVLKGDKYTVEVSGSGYLPYKGENIDFSSALELTNADFVPGDVDNNGVIDNDDVEKIKNYISAGEYRISADFNRDGLVNEEDLKILGVEEDTSAQKPEKMARPTISGGKNKVTVKWTKPSDSTVSGYVIKYGTDKSNLKSSKEVTSASTTSFDITGLSADTKYYVQIAAKNSAGIGEYSDVVDATTNKSESTGSTGGGGGGGGGGSYNAPTTNTDNNKKDDNNSSSAKPDEFTDLGNYAWAKDSIYALKEKGIISGTSETEFSPQANIKRGDFILILTRMLGINDSFTENFADVPESAYYYNAIGSAKVAGIAQGADNLFMPENSITRQDLITLAYRAFLSKGYIEESSDMSVLDEFADAWSISPYAQGAMASMVKAGIIKGSDGNVNPLGNATRAEVAVMCARLVELIK